MGRLLFVFLLLVLPFQFIWAAAAPYCSHEAGAATKEHFGHHEHKHQAGEVVSATDDNSDGAGAYHADCESCHLGSCAFPPAAAADTDALPQGQSLGHREPRYHSHVPDGPLRPDRAHPTPAARFSGGVVVALTG